MSLVTFAQLQRSAGAQLQEAGVETAGLDARILLAHCAGIPYFALISCAKDEVLEEVQNKYKSVIEQRIAGKPVYRIIGKREFFGREFIIADNVLDPRPETELLVERILQDFAQKEAHFAEIGVGSGVISISLLLEQDQFSAIGSDISQDAINATEANLKLHDIEKRLSLKLTDCLEGIKGPFDFIVSNPPYIDSVDMSGLQKEVRDFDPHIALDGGKDGLEFFERILTQAKPLLKTKGKLYLETGAGQHEILIKLAKQMGWGLVSAHLDLSGIERFVVFEVLAD